jgi:hypothetical protein
MSESAFKVVCAKCKRAIAWKAEYAGKRGKCKCGAVMTMPLEPPPLAKELAVDAKRALVEPPPIPIAAASAAPAFSDLPTDDPNPLDYRHSQEIREARLFSFKAITEPVRDVYAPATILAIGFLAAMAWALTQTNMGAVGVIATCVAAGILTLVKVAVLIGLALLVAPALDISFGLMGPAILKFAAIIIFVDTAELWLNAIFRATGAISPSGQTSLYIILPRLGLATTLIGIMCFYLFSMEPNEVALFAIPMAIVSWLVEFVLDVVLFIIVSAVMAAHHAAVVAATAPPAAAPAGAPAATVPSAAPAAPVPAAVPATEFDLQIIQRVNEHVAQEGNQWKLSYHYSAFDKRTGDLIDRMYAAGAFRVYIDLLAGVSHAGDHTVLSREAYVELPASDDQMAACLDVAHAYRTANGQPADSPMDFAARRFIVVDLKQ